tara:strand:+ start:496 stop:3045 length:2550 start_codon:yes stop_codon:yes gene_type:complete
MAVDEEILKTLQELNKKLAKGGTGSKESLTVDVNITNEKLEESNEKLRELRQEISDYNDEIAAAKAAGQDYIELQRDLTEAQKDYNDELAETVDKEREAAKERAKQEKGLKDLKEGIVGLSSRMNEVSSLSRELQRTGAASAEVSRMAIRMGDQLRISGVSYEELTQATKSLVSGVTDFTMMDKELQKSLMKDAALFQEAGVSNETYSKAMQIGMKNMGLSANQASTGLRKLDIFARELEIPMNELIEDFTGAEEKMAQLGSTGVESFKEMARVSKITGLEMGKLISMTDKFDTFEGAAEQAGSLNAALGGNFVDSMSLMMEDDPAERFKMIRDAIEASGTAVEDMTRKQKMFISNAAGFESVSDFTAAMSGDLSALQKEMGDAEATPVADNLEKTARNLRSQTELIENAAKAATPAFGTLAAKAERFTDQYADGIMKAAEAVQEANTKVTQTIPDFAVAGLGAAEGAFDIYDSIMEFLEKIESAIIGIIAFPGKIKAGFTKVKGFLGGMKTKIVDTFGWFTGKGKYKKNLSFFEKIQFKGMQIGESMKTLKTKAGNAIKPLTTGFTKVAKVGNKFGSTLTKLGKGLKTFGKTNPVTIAIFGMIDGFFKVKAAAGDFADYLGGGFIGAFGAFAELGDFIFGGFIGDIAKFFGKDIGDTGLISLIGQGINKLIGGVEMSFADAWDALDWGFIGETFEYMFDSAITAVKDILGIASPSKVMSEIGSDMITGIVDTIIAGGSVLGEAAMSLINKFTEPWTTIGSLLMEIIQPALDIVPDGIKNLFMGDTATTATNLQVAAAPAAAGVAAAAGGATGGEGQAQVINISLNLDGKQIDKKIVNVIGGVIKEAVL